MGVEQYIQELIQNDSGSVWYPTVSNRAGVQFLKLYQNGSQTEEQLTQTQLYQLGLQQSDFKYLNPSFSQVHFVILVRENCILFSVDGLQIIITAYSAYFVKNNQDKTMNLIPKLRALLQQELKQLSQIVPVLYSAMRSKGSQKFDVRNLPFELVVLEFCLDAVSQNFHTQLQNLVQSITEVSYQIRLQVTYKVLERLGLLKVQLNRMNDKVITVQELFQSVNDADTDLQNFFIAKYNSNSNQHPQTQSQSQLQSYSQTQTQDQTLAQTQTKIQSQGEGHDQLQAQTNSHQDSTQSPYGQSPDIQYSHDPSAHDQHTSSNPLYSSSHSAVAPKSRDAVKEGYEDPGQGIEKEETQVEAQGGQGDKDYGSNDRANGGLKDGSKVGMFDGSKDQDRMESMQGQATNEEQGQGQEQGQTISYGYEQREIQEQEQLDKVGGSNKDQGLENNGQHGCGVDQFQNDLPHKAGPHEQEYRQQIQEEGAFEVEVLVEAYMLMINSLVSRLDDLREYIEDTEDSVQMTLSTQRNNLIEIRLLLVVIILCLNIPFAIHGFFAMNFPNSPIYTQSDYNTFLEITLAQVLGPFLLFIIYLFWAWRFNFMTFLSNRQGSIVALRKDIGTKQLPSYLNRPLNYLMEGQQIGFVPEQPNIQQ